MKAFVIVVVLISAVILFAAPAVNETNPLFQAFCVDGDGALSDWVTSREEAYLMGRDHERANRGHRWEVLVQQGDNSVLRVPACARLTEDAAQNKLRLENLCDKCVKFTVTRKAADGTTKTRDITIQPKKSRYFRKLPDSIVNVDAESDCSQ